jgi:hypothetical protein
MSVLRLASFVIVAGGLSLIWGCSSTPHFVARHEPWRADEEQACLSSGVVRETRWVQSRSALGGPSVCGASQPFEMSAAAGGMVTMRPPALLRCPMVPQVERWITTVVDPAARAHFGVALSEIKVAASYSCRPMNNVFGARLSEHGHANALDVAGFLLVDGRTITVKGGWNGAPQEQEFLRAVHRGACREFTTVLGPEADANHRDHFHVDLARHGRDGLGRICK